MGCAQSSVQVAPPTAKKAGTNATAAVAAGAAPGAPASASSCALAQQLSFPMHVMCMKDFLALEELRPHNELVKEGLVVPLDTDRMRTEQINFVSHQWLGWKIADPENAHLRTMQTVFRTALEGDPKDVFRDEEQCSAYMQGMSKANLSNASSAYGSVDMSAISSRGLSVDAFKHSIGPETSWVWMDFISIPQTVGCASEAEVEEALAGQAAAITSIPAYVAAVNNFFVCAPAGAKHVDLGEACSYETWFSRGWCRLEETILMLARWGDGRPLFVTQPVGTPPRLFTYDQIDRLWMAQQRHSSVLTGNFSCCRMGHIVAMPNGGKSVCIPCDKDRLRPVLEQALAEATASLHDLSTTYDQPSFYARVGASFRDDKKPYFMHFTFNVLRSLILAADATETDAALVAWPQDADGVTPEGVASDYAAKYGLTLDEACPPADESAPLCFLAASEGNLPMLRYLHERRGCPLDRGNPFDMTPLLVAARFGHIATLRYLTAHLPTEALDKTTARLGLSPMGDAAKCGHPEAVNALLASGASTEPRRKDNGRTPLLEACANGNAECARRLLAAGANARATDSDGATAADLAAAAPKGGDAALAAVREFEPAGGHDEAKAHE